MSKIDTAPSKPLYFTPSYDPGRLGVADHDRAQRHTEYDYEGFSDRDQFWSPSVDRDLELVFEEQA